MADEVLTEGQQVNIELGEESAFQIEIGSELVISDGYDEYNGPFTVTPSSVSQTLPTADRYVSKNIEVEKIPYAEVSNSAGGKTATIG